MHGFYIVPPMVFDRSDLTSSCHLFAYDCVNLPISCILVCIFMKDDADKNGFQVDRLAMSHDPIRSDENLKRRLFFNQKCTI